MKDVSIIIPSYKPDEKMLKAVIELENAGFEDIIVVDDGGGAEYNKYFDELRERESCTVLVHEINRGKGAAMKTAFSWYIDNRQGYGVITVDADGQHLPADVLKISETMRKTGEMVLGVRDFSLPEVPSRSKIGNKFTSNVFRVLVGLKCSDTQTGLRAFPSAVLSDMISVSGDRYEYETNMLLFMKSNNIKFSEVKIKTVYLNENESSHFRPIRDSLRIYSLIFKYIFTTSFMKFMGSSLISYIIDIGLFTGFCFLLSGTSSNFWKTTLPYALARFISSFVNYSLNRKVFAGGETSVKKTVFKYYLLAISILLIGSAAVTLIIGSLNSINSIKTIFAGDSKQTLLKTLIKIPVDCILYIVSYTTQKKYIFKKK